ncbi:acetolactate decarboxylase [Lactovum odontotermitis]
MAALYQFNTLASLMSGFYDGQISVSDITQHGDFGLGSFDQVDGEMIVLDGQVYQARGDNSVRIADSAQTSPYLAVTQQKADVKFGLMGNFNLTETEKQIENRLISRNLFHSVKIHGDFPRMKIRMATKTPSGVGFDVVSAHQAEYELSDLTGTIVGFWAPSLFQGAALAGFHLHFISDDKTVGGHVYDFDMENAEVELGKIDRIEQDFSIHDENFLKNEIDLQKINEIIELTE